MAARSIAWLSFVSAASLAAAARYPVTGIILEVDRANRSFVASCGAIPGYMEAMAMDFEVKNTNELTGLSAGDYVSFRMIVQPKDAWIDQITRLTNSKPVANAPDTFRRVRDVDPLNIGDPLPEYHFTNEMNQPVSFSDFKGQALGITFLFTRCPFPTFCPRMASNFDEALKKLKADTNAPTNWHLLTITFDPAFDTPAVLKSYAKRYTYDPSHWSYLTGELIDAKSGQTIPLKTLSTSSCITSFEAKTVSAAAFWLERLWMRCGRSRM